MKDLNPKENVRITDWFGFAALTLYKTNKGPVHTGPLTFSGVSYLVYASTQE